jgi:hypothetical protein
MLKRLENTHTKQRLILVFTLFFQLWLSNGAKINDDLKLLLKNYDKSIPPNAFNEGG